MNEDQNNNVNAVSVYEQDGGGEDFPVLKAFQQYIDAEQNKARKRMVYLSIFFGCLMTIVIAVFMVMMNTISSRNQELNDRLVEFAMKDRERALSVQQPVVQPAPAQQNDAALKAFTETLMALQRELTAAKTAAAQPAPVLQPAVQVPAVNAAAEQAKNEELEKLKRANALLKEEKLRLAKKEKELMELEAKRKHEEEVEQHRRRLYPEYYAQQDAAKAAAKKREAEDAKRAADAEAIGEIEKINDADDDELIQEFSKNPVSNWTFPD